MKKLFVPFLALALVAGCAGPKVRPSMSSDQAQPAAMALYAARYCVAQGHMSPETGAMGATTIHRWSDNFKDSGPLFAELRSLERTRIEVSAADCRKASMVILEAQAKQNKADEDAAYRAQAVRELSQQLNDFGKDFPRTRVTNCTRTMMGASCTTY